MITEYATLAHVIWDCSYHVVINPKYRKKLLFGQVKKRLGEILRKLAKEKEIEIVEGHVCLDHVHMVLRIPPKYSVAMAIGFMKGKSAIILHREFGKHYKSSRGMHFWSRGYYVSTVGLDKEAIKKYVREQEAEERRVEGGQLDFSWG
jgi:putative transposase